MNILKQVTTRTVNIAFIVDYFQQWTYVHVTLYLVFVAAGKCFEDLFCHMRETQMSGKYWLFGEIYELLLWILA